MPTDDPYQTPRSALEENAEPTQPLSRLEEGIVDFMAASRIRTIVFIVIAMIFGTASLYGMLATGPAAVVVSPRGLNDEAAVIFGGSIFVLTNCVLSIFGMWRYLVAINRVARTYDRGDLAVAIRRRRFARVGWFAMIGLLIVSVFVPLIFLD
jgi:hypothetical protein